MAPPPIAAGVGEGRAAEEERREDEDDAPNVELNRAFCAMPETIFQTMSTLAAKHQCIKYEFSSPL